jgi:hypothetical protein
VAEEGKAKTSKPQRQRPPRSAKECEEEKASESQLRIIDELWDLGIERESLLRLFFKRIDFIVESLNTT